MTDALALSTTAWAIPVPTGDDAWTIATAACAAVACAVLGCFLVLRRMSMLGDAISHAILPGIVAAFIITSSRGVLPMLAGATVVGVLTAVFTAAIHRWGRIPEDAAMGVVFTTLFALGVLMIAWVPRDVDLDPGCVLYGLLEFVALDRVWVLGVEVPRAMLWLAATLLVVVGAVWAGYKELKVVSFDPALAASMGISVALVHHGFLALVAATTVVSFEAVGSILVIVMLIAPAAAAHLLTDRLASMIWIAAGLAVTSSVLGYVMALWVDTSAAGMISVVSGGQFVAAMLLAPRHGLVSKALGRSVLAMRISREDVLGILYRWHERRDRGAAGSSPTSAEIAGAIGSPVLARLAIRSLSRRGLAEPDGGGLRLTEDGLRTARGIVRSHRLWETFLAKRLGLPVDHLHEPSHRVEHFITEDLQTSLVSDLGTRTDPHGSEIPQSSPSSSSGASSSGVRARSDG